jgi:hypothetical protein
MSLLRTTKELSELNEQQVTEPQVTATVKDEKVLTNKRLAKLLCLMKEAISILDKVIQGEREAVQ